MSHLIGRSLSLSGLLNQLIPTEHFCSKKGQVSGLAALICINAKNCLNCFVESVMDKQPGLINGLLQMTTTGKRWTIFEMFVVWGLSG